MARGREEGRDHTGLICVMLIPEESQAMGAMSSKIRARTGSQRMSVSADVWL